MRVSTNITGQTQAIAALDGSAEHIRANWKREANQLGAAGVKLAKHYREGRGTTPTQTAVRSGALRRSITHKISALGRADIMLELGYIRPGTGGNVLIYAATHEYGATIKAKNSPWLTFPYYEKGRGGMAKSNIAGWARAKSVTIPPRPALVHVEKLVEGAWQERAARAFENAVNG